MNGFCAPCPPWTAVRINSIRGRGARQALRRGPAVPTPLPTLQPTPCSPRSCRLPGRFHLGEHVRQWPAGEIDEVLRLLLEALRQLGAIPGARLAARWSPEGMVEHVAALEVLAVAWLRQHA